MRKILVILLAVFTFSSSLVFTHLYGRNDDLSLRYMLWKKGLCPYPADTISNSVIADKDRDKLIIGKSKEEILRIFPSASDDFQSDHQRQYQKELMGKEFLWLGDFGVIIFLENGIGKEISIMKG